jgi:hypothetical protein
LIASLQGDWFQRSVSSEDKEGSAPRSVVVFEGESISGAKSRATITLLKEGDNWRFHSLEFTPI